MQRPTLPTSPAKAEPTDHPLDMRPSGTDGDCGWGQPTSRSRLLDVKSEAGNSLEDEAG